MKFLKVPVTGISSYRQTTNMYYTGKTHNMLRTEYIYFLHLKNTSNEVSARIYTCSLYMSTLSNETKVLKHIKLVGADLKIRHKAIRRRACFTI